MGECRLFFFSPLCVTCCLPTVHLCVCPHLPSFIFSLPQGSLSFCELEVEMNTLHSEKLANAKWMGIIEFGIKCTNMVYLPAFLCVYMGFSLSNILYSMLVNLSPFLSLYVQVRVPSWMQADGRVLGGSWLPGCDTPF